MIIINPHQPRQSKQNISFSNSVNNSDINTSASALHICNNKNDVCLDDSVHFNEHICMNNHNVNFDIKFDFQQIYQTISEVYFPIVNNMNLSNDDHTKININTILTRISKCIQQNNSLFAYANTNINNDNTLHYFLTKAKEYENMILSLFIHFIQLKLNLSYQLIHIKPIQMNVYYTKLKYCFNALYKMSLFFLFIWDETNSNSNNSNDTITNINTLLSFKNLCMKYVNNYFTKSKYYNKPLSYIIEHIPNEMHIIEHLLLSILNELINNYHSSIYGISSSLLNKTFLKQINLFEKFYSILNNKSSFYTSTEGDSNEMLSILNSFQNNMIVKEPFLPKLNTLQYKYTIVFDLDETLIHCSKDLNINSNTITTVVQPIIKIRPYAIKLIVYLSQYFELVLFTASIEEYADIVSKCFDKYIHYKLYRKHTTKVINENGKEIYVKDLRKLGRCLNNICIVDNNQDSFLFQKENGLEISGFYGDDNDKELLYLQNDLMSIYHDDVDDIRCSLKTIRDNMKKRYE